MKVQDLTKIGLNEKVVKIIVKRAEQNLLRHETPVSTTIRILAKDFRGDV